MVERLKKLVLRVDKSYMDYLWRWAMRTGQAEKACDDHWQHEAKKRREQEEKKS